MKTAQEWFDEANALYEKGKFLEADKCLDEVLALDNKFMQAYRWKFKLFYSLGKYQDMIKWCDKAIEVDPNYFFAYNSKANACKNLGKFQLALENYEKAISIDPNNDMPYNGKANALSNLGRHEEAIEYYNKSIVMNPNTDTAYTGKAGSLWRLGRLEEAFEAYSKGIENNPKSTLCLCNRGKFLSYMGKQQEALADFKKIKQLHQSGYIDIGNNADTRRFIENTLKSIVELDDMSAETETAIKNADQNNPTVQKFVKNMKILQENKNKITANLISNMDKNNTSETNQMMQELQKLKQEFVEMQKEIATVKKDVKKLDDQMKDVREELENKLDDFHKKLDKELNKLDLTPEDQQKLKEYFKAFIETFSSLYVTAQVVDSGQVQLDSDSKKTTILSTIASFAPFVGNILSQSIKTVGEFLASKEIKTNARMMKGLASDSSALSQLIGRTAYEVVLNKDKQAQIMKVTMEDLKQPSNSLFQKIKQICNNIEEELDAFLYTKLYKTPAARLGHLDANDLIGLWLNDSIDAFNIEAEFVKKATVVKKEEFKKELQEECKEGVSTGKQPPSANRSSCCNMF